MSNLKGCDVSEFQANMSFAKYDFVLVRASYGGGGVDAMVNSHADRALAEGKLLGFYHYAYPDFGNTPAEEASTFLSVVRSYFGKCLLALDWEGDAVRYPVEWAEKWLEIVQSETGTTPLFYTFAAEAEKVKYRELAVKFPLWLADWSGAYSRDTVWKAPTIWQYRGSPLDLDEFFGSRSDWEQMAKGGEDEVSYDDFKKFMAQYEKERAGLNAGPWAKDAIEAMKESGVMVGGPDGTFRPKSNVTREELAVALSKLGCQQKC